VPTAGEVLQGALRHAEDRGQELLESRIRAPALGRRRCWPPRGSPRISIHNLWISRSKVLQTSPRWLS
jgi:hypothetical protein